MREESEKLERERKKKEAEKKAKVSEKKGYEKKPNKRRERDGGKNAAVCEDASDSEGESPGSHGLFRACRCEAR